MIKTKVKKRRKNLPENISGHTAWLYWEGECPEWIMKCRETVFAHLGNQVRIVSPDDFDKLRNKDRDIDLSGLCIAHRADFIRAFLLAEYGGIWMDSDCLVMQSLAPLFDLLNDYDFIGYRERSGEVTNNFMGARADSQIAKAYYNSICQILRSGQKLEWLTIGSHALSATIKNINVAWYELNVEQIQPICWSDPQAFFKQERREKQEEKFNPASYCYMISANMANGVVRDNPAQDLLHENSFFNYLHNKSIEQAMLAKLTFRKNTDDDRWVIPEVIQEDMYRVKNVLSTFAPQEKAYIIDCGAHIGAFSVMCARYIPNVAVLAFEPNSESYNYLCKNTEAFGKIEAINKAVGVEDGKLNLYAPDQSGWTGRWTAIPNANDHEVVKAIDLFSFIQNLDQPVFILKLDIQGYEELVIAHGKKEYFEKVNIIILEAQAEEFDEESFQKFGFQLLFRPHISSHRQFVFKKEIENNTQQN